MTPERIAAFWNHVDRRGPDECWLWTASQRGNGYGCFSVEGKTESSHVLAFVLTFGPVPENLYVCHTCDVKACCNPTHLYAGTPKENWDDANARGLIPRGRSHWRHTKPERAATGIRHGMARLNEEQVRQIRVDASNNLSKPAIAQKYGISVRHTYRILNAQVWKETR